MPEMKTTVDGNNGSLDIIKEKKSELEVTAIKTIQSEKEKRE